MLLLLIHGQTVDWQSHARVLPELARDFTVYAVDVHGHGQSARAPEKYTAAAIGADLARFVEEIIGKRVDSGHNVHGEKRRGSPSLSAPSPRGSDYRAQLAS